MNSFFHKKILDIEDDSIVGDDDGFIFYADNEVDYDALETPAFLRRLSSFGELIAGDIEE